MKSSQPEISVIIPAHNSATTIARALKSVRCQKMDGVEVVIVDDASVDGTVDQLDQFADLDIIYVRSEQNVGAAEARNLAISRCSGEFIAFLDADDEWLAGKLAAQMAVLRGNSDAAYVYCEALEFEPGLRELGYTNYRFGRPSGCDAWKTLLRESCVTTSCVMARRNLIEQVGGFRKHLLSGQDQDLWIRLALVGDVEYQSATYVHYYILNDSLSQRRLKSAVSDLLPVIEEYIDENREKLSDSEVADIMALRLNTAAKALYRGGDLVRGAGLFREAIRNGASKSACGSFVVKNSPPALWLKSKLSDPPIRLDRQFDKNSEAAPKLMIVVDTEEEFEWDQPFGRENRSVKCIEKQVDAQNIFRRYGLSPTYVVDYPVVQSEKSVSILREFQDNGECTIGAHLHPWVNPPYDEQVGNLNSYPGNLPFAQEFKKLEFLTGAIEDAFGARPNIYKAGRYGFGPSTARILKTLGYEIDLSVVPYTSFEHQEGPNFEKLPSQPFWMGDELDLLEIPLTRSFNGLLSRAGKFIYPLVSAPRVPGRWIAGLLAKSGMLERITLTPEGVELSEMKRLVKRMQKSGAGLFCLTYHSSSLLVGGSPYVRNELERTEFLNRLEGFLEFFFEECGGVPATPGDILAGAKGALSV